MLSKRLNAIASLVDKDMVIADIGTDHAFLPIYLIKHEIIKKAYAFDNKIGPLKQAIKNINDNGLSDSIIAYQANGLENLPSDVNTIIIAGMGVNTIIDILNQEIDKVKKLDCLILQPNNNVFLLRSWLNKQGFMISDELLIKDYKYYQVVVASPLKKGQYNELEVYFGPCLLNKKDDIFIEYHLERYQKLKVIYQNHPKKAINEDFLMLQTLFKELL